MNHFFRGKKLSGIDSIMKHVTVQGAETILQWIIEYDFPAKKEAGVYVAFTGDIKKWRKDHPDVKEYTRPYFDIFRTIETRGRFGQRMVTIKKFTI